MATMFCNIWPFSWSRLFRLKQWTRMSEDGRRDDYDSHQVAPPEVEDEHADGGIPDQVAPTEAEGEHRNHGDCDATGHDVCPRCKSVPWAELAREGEPDLVVMAVSESWEQLQSSRCPLCRLLSTIKPRTVEQGTAELRLFSARAALALHSPHESGPIDYRDGRFLSFSDSQNMCEWTDGFLALSNPSEQLDYGIRHLDPRKADFGFIRQCLERCRQTHWDCCNEPKGSAPSNLRVIDCQLPIPAVVPAPRDCQYAALSYVWGSPQAPAMEYQTSEEFPRVVLDAILATTSLGIRYMWVDRYVSLLVQIDDYTTDHAISALIKTMISTNIGKSHKWVRYTPMLKSPW